MTVPPERPIPMWQKLVALLYVAVCVALVVVFRSRLHADLWPLDASRVAPNILATVIQLLIATPFAVLLWPPTRRRIHRFVDHHTAGLHAKLNLLHEQRERHHAEQMAKMEAIHEHLKQTHPLRSSR